MTRSAVRSRLAPPRFAFGYAWRSHVVEGEACRGVAHLGEDGQRKSPPDISLKPHSVPDEVGFGYARRSHVVEGEACRGVARRVKTGLSSTGRFAFYLPVNLGGRFSMKLATPSRKSLPRSATTISRLASIVASARVWNGTS
jgi:hypothetical protein